MNLKQCQLIKQRLIHLTSTRAGVDKIPVAKVFIAPSDRSLFKQYIEELAMLNFKFDTVTNRYIEQDLNVYFMYVMGDHLRTKGFTDFINENGIFVPMLMNGVDELI